jgi:hypoxanthine phosphoribosyltransferase
MARLSGFPECAARARQPLGPADREFASSVNTTIADPRLEGRSVKRIAFTAEELRVRVAELGDEITRAYPDGDLLVLGLLKGSFIFLSDLVRCIQRPIKVDFLVASSYGNETQSSGFVRLVYDPETELEGKHILLVEDIVDSGRTLSRVMDVLRQRNPRSLEICALLDKHIATHLSYPSKFVGFDAPNEFLVGYGLDHAESFRHLPYIASLQ